MDVQIRVDGHATLTALERLFRDQLPFATSLAINKADQAARAAVQAGIRERFTVRRPWVLQGVVVDASTKTNLRATVRMADDRRFLSKFEAGGTLGASSPERPLAIPSVNLRPAFADVVPRALYPSSLRLVPRRGVTGILPARRHLTPRGMVQLQGKQRTFVLDATMFGVQTPGVYQRIGPGPHDIRLLWIYKQREPIPARLQFNRTVAETIHREWSRAYAAAFAQAVRTAR